MNLKLRLQTAFLILAISLPSLALSYHLYTQWLHCDGAYMALIESQAKLKPSSSLENRAHQREGIIKQIWFRPLEKGASLYLQAHSSKLIVKSVDGHIRAKERLYNVFAGFQDAPSLAAHTLGHHWLLRILRAKAADFDYTHQTLDAAKVDLEIYQLQKAYDVANLAALSQHLATVIGSCKRIHLDCKASPPHFKAKKFRAFINPQAATGSS